METKTVVVLGLLGAGIAYLVTRPPADEPLVQPNPLPADFEHDSYVYDTLVAQMRELGFPRFGVAGVTADQGNEWLATVLRSEGVTLDPRLGRAMTITTVDKAYRRRILQQAV